MVFIKLVFIGVVIRPGAMAFTRIPYLPKSAAGVIVKLMILAFANP